MAKNKINNDVDVFDVVISDDKHFSKDNFSKGTNRRLIAYTKNKQTGTISVLKGHSLGKNNAEKKKRKLKETKGHYLKVSDGTNDFYVENIPISEFNDGSKIFADYKKNKNKIYPGSTKIVPKDREKVFRHVMDNKKQKNQSRINKKNFKRFKSKKKKRG